MIILDSNVWIAFLDKSDSQHKQAEKIFNELKQKIIITEYIILEVCSVLSLKVNKKVADSFIEMAFNNRDIEVLLSDEHFFKETTKLFLNCLYTHLSFADISLLYLSNFYNVITFDKELQKAINSNI